MVRTAPLVVPLPLIILLHRDPTIGRSKKIKRLAKPMMIVASQATPANGSPTMPEATDLPLDSAFLRSRVVGTTSAKLSYLCSEILKYYQQEKILVFYGTSPGDTSTALLLLWTPRHRLTYDRTDEHALAVISFILRARRL